MSQVKCQHCGEFIFDHAGCYQRAKDFKELKELIDFIKEVSDNFGFNQSDEQALKNLVYFENKADELLTKIRMHTI